MTDEALPTVALRWNEHEVERFYAQGHWRPETLWDEVTAQAAARPDAVFLSDGTRELTYGALRDEAEAFAAALHDLGLVKGDRILVQLPNWAEFGVVLVGASRAGVITVPVMTIYRDDDVGYILEHAGARLVVTAGEFKGFDFAGMHRGLRESCPAVESIVVVRAEPCAGELALEQLTAAPVDASGVEAAGPDDGHLIIYTSGTTSRPKGCVHTWNTVQFSARAMGRELGWNPDDVAFGPSPVAHGTGYLTSIAGPLLAGASSHLMDSWEPVEALHRIERFGCTATTTATPFLQMLVAAYDPAVHDVGSMRVWVCAGSPIPSVVVEEARKILDGCEILSLYGRSENFLTTMCGVGDAPERATTSDGRAVDGIEVAIVDPAGAALPTGETGDIAYRGPGHMLTYFRDPVQTAELFTPGRFSRSGDLGHMDGDGYVRVSGRLKDIIIRGGLNISAREVEDHLMAHPAVTSAAVVAMPDDRLGERVCACVTVAAGQAFDFAEMGRFLSEDRGLTIQKRPERLEVVEEMPMTATGKVQKHVLRAAVAEALAGPPLNP